MIFAAALWMAVAGPRPAWAQYPDDSHDAGDEEMLTGEAPSNAPRRVAPARSEEGPPPELSFVTRLDKTAVWVGDQFHYQIIVDHDPKIQFVLENLKSDTINM
ncbi:MAG TPA: hypothetical protein VJ417_07040, partial [Candidatus Glassbacteria bacterium]|nr:hypothetical protein [Candidatus Glassbacteria bacterium]